MPRNPVPSRDRCAADCGRRHAPNDVLCSVCRKRKERSFGAPGRAVAIPPLDKPQLAKNDDEREQERAMEELGRCEYCGMPWGGHLASCWGRMLDLDARGFEYRDLADAAEQGEAP